MADDELVVRACRVDDAAGLAAMYALDRGEIEGAEPWRAPSFFEVDGQVERISRSWVEHRTLGFVALRRDRIVGLFVLEDVTDDSAFVGYHVAADRRRQGVASCGLASLADIAFGEVGLRTIVADIEPHNIASCRVVERNGFRHEGSVTIDDVHHERWVLNREDAASGA